MNAMKFKGFTLVEMMVVVSMVALSAIYFTQLFIEDIESKVIDREVAAMMTIGAAAIGYVQEHGGWPDQGAASPCSSALSGNMGDYLGDVSVVDLSTACDEVNNRHPIFKTIRSNFDTVSIAMRVAAMLPSASVSGKDVIMYTPRPRRESAVFPPVYGLVTADGNGNASVLMPEECEDPRIIVFPELICSNSLTLGGYRVYADEDGDSWSIYLKARSEDQSEAYTKVEKCNVATIDKPEDDLLSYRYLKFCI